MSTSTPLEVRSTYIRDALKPRVLRANAREILTDPVLGAERFDTIVGTGISGVLPLQTIASVFKTHTMVVRKKGEQSHCSKQVEGVMGGRWLFVDDFIATGNTFVRAWWEINNACRGYKFPHTCIGAFSYSSTEVKRYHTMDELAERYGCVRDLRREFAI